MSTNVGMFSSVIAFVYFQTASSNVRVVTLATFIWPFSGVLSLVALQMTSISAGIVALVTLKRLLSRMCRPYVSP